MAELIMWLVLALVLLLGPVIMVHELGHFLVAKRAGVRVLEFGLGFPPRLLTLIRERGTLELNGIRVALPPLLRLPGKLEAGKNVEVLARCDENGQYQAVKVVSLEPHRERQSPPRRPEEGDWTLSLPAEQVITPAASTPAPPSVAEEATGPAPSPDSPPPPVTEKTAEGMLLRGPLSAWEPGTAYTLNLLPLGAFVRMLGEENPSDPRSLAAKPKRWRLAAIAAGPLANLLAAFLLMVTAYMAGVPERHFVEVQEVLADTPAQAAGLQSGDVITAVDGVTIQDGTQDLRTRIRARPEQEIALTVLRDDEELTLTVTPRREEDGSGYVGISMGDWADAGSVVHYSLPRAVVAAGEEVGVIFTSIFNLPRAVATGQIQPSEVRPAGLPGILQWLGLALKQSIEWGIPLPALQLTALISLAIGLTNLLPLPALDGGRILFIFLEAIRRRRVSPETEAIVHLVGMGILVAISLFIIVQDIVNPIIPWSLLSR